MKTDRELLELAAKAAGVCLHPADKLTRSYGNWGCDTTCTVCKKEPSDARWNPLTDDGDALRLAVKLRMDVQQCSEWTDVWVGPVNYEVEHKSDPYAATRLAIVRAAAAIGEAMP